MKPSQENQSDYDPEYFKQEAITENLYLIQLFVAVLTKWPDVNKGDLLRIAKYAHWNLTKHIDEPITNSTINKALDRFTGEGWPFNNSQLDGSKCYIINRQHYLHFCVHHQYVSEGILSIPEMEHLLTGDVPTGYMMPRIVKDKALGARPFVSIY